MAPPHVQGGTDLVMAPADEAELVHMVHTCAEYDDGPIAVRYPRGGGTGVALPAVPERLATGLVAPASACPTLRTTTRRDPISVATPARPKPRSGVIVARGAMVSSVTSCARGDAAKLQRSDHCSTAIAAPPSPPLAGSSPGASRKDTPSRANSLGSTDAKSSRSGAERFALGFALPLFSPRVVRRR